MEKQQYIYRGYAVDVYKSADEYQFKAHHTIHLFILASGLNGYKTVDLALDEAKKLINVMEK